MHRFCLTYNFKLLWYIPGADKRQKAIEEWLANNIPENEFSFEFENYGQHGEYILHVSRIEDFIALKLAIGV